MDLREKKHFYFTQNSLNTFLKCPFSFKKKYIDNVKWQQDDSFFNTEKIEFGNDFHKIAQRYFLGISLYEESFLENEDLFLAYKNLCEYFPINNNYKYYPEYSIRFSSGDIRLEANIDLVIDKGDCLEIWDFKTNAKKESKKYIDSMQTKVYMYVVKKCMDTMFNKENATIKMAYFSPENKCELGNIVYSDENFKKDEKYITNLIEKIYNFKWEEFDRNDFIKQCNFCEFNLFCSKREDTTQDFLEVSWDDVEEIF